MDYEEALRIVVVCRDFVTEYMCDRPHEFEMETGYGLTQDDVKAAFRKVQNG